jgi:hypothetical protein
MPENENVIDLSTLEFPSDPSKLPTSKELPLGTVELEITGWSASLTKKVTQESDPVAFGKGNRGEKLALKAQFKVTSPVEFAGLPYTHNFYVGSNTDQLAKKESTWASGGGTEVMKVLKQAGVSLGATTKPMEATAASVGQRILAEVKVETDRTGKFPDKHIVRGWYKVGTRPVALLDSPVSFGGQTQAASAPVFDNND